MIRMLVSKRRSFLRRRRRHCVRRPLQPAQDKVSFGTNWVAQAEHGGFYQAVADGTYTSTAST